MQDKVLRERELHDRKNKQLYYEPPSSMKRLPKWNKQQN